MKKIADISAICNAYIKRNLFRPASLAIEPNPETRLIIVIPVFDEPAICETLSSLCTCEPSKHPVEVLCVVNHSESASEQAKEQSARSLAEISNWRRAHDSEKLRIHAIDARDLPRKHAGVGLARKIGMDEALQYFAQIDRDGCIVNLDADCTVAPNYLAALETELGSISEPYCASIQYAHDLENSLYPQRIISYETHLRYYVLALQWAGFYHAIQTVGSSMACSVSAYALENGMNRKKAAEDFYFMHKLASKYRHFDLRSTTVFPSGRTSDRVPFGTGKAMADLESVNQSAFHTYPFELFAHLKPFFDSFEAWCQKGILSFPATCDRFHPELKAFLNQTGFQDELNECLTHTASPAAALKRLRAKFDGLKVLRLVNQLSAKSFPKVPADQAARDLLSILNCREAQAKSLQVLEILRKL